MKRKWLILSALMVVVMITIVNVHGSENYTDIKTSHWAYQSIRSMSEENIVSGYPDGNFLPNRTVTYGEFIKMMVLAYTGELLDLSQTEHWAMNYYNKGIEKKLFQEFRIPKSCLNREIPRNYMAYIISNALGDFTVDHYVELSQQIRDISASTIFEYDILKSYSKNILNGYPDGNFQPDGTLSRAEAAVVISNYLAVKRGGIVELPQIIQVDENKRNRTQLNLDDPQNHDELDSVDTLTVGKENLDWSDLSQICSNYYGSKPIYEIAENWDRTRTRGNKTESCAAQIQYYAILNDCPYAFELSYHETTGTKNIKMNHYSMGVNAVLIKDGNVMLFQTPIELSSSKETVIEASLKSYGFKEENDTLFAPYYEYLYESMLLHPWSVPINFDYIGFFTSEGNTLICIPNSIR